MLPTEQMKTVRGLVAQASAAFAKDLPKIEKQVSFGYEINPGRKITKDESQKLLEVLQRVEGRRMGRQEP